MSSSFVPLRTTSDRPDTFDGRISTALADDVHIAIVEAGRHTAERTPQLIDSSPRHYYKLQMLLAGSGMLVQHGRDVVMRPGEITLYDTAHPYTLDFAGDLRCIVVMFPSSMADLPPADVLQLVATPLRGSAGMGSLVAPFLRSLADNLPQVESRSGVRLAHATVDLTLTMLARELELTRGGLEHRDRTFQDIVQHIEDNLGSTDLSPTTIAAASYVSVRHLHALFHDRGTTVSAWVRRRRLEQCRRRLTDPTLADQSIMTIASRWGFVDAAHFSRAFRAEFGMSPSEARRRG
ncbi:helix-turn-helix domain-containing protein [Xylanimonas allomyrinae]|uniref:AraC-like ligand-binding domain-containing protein n=1 Tax=Xylanimonas allomyrinae TaxID=2509459 RepID=UPI001B85F0CD|nr:helix-turn-helix domain-containing protein [Xylanimonas allomyrinae]